QIKSNISLAAREVRTKQRKILWGARIFLFSFTLLRRQLISTLFPYTTLFRSNIRHNLSSSKGPKPLQLKLLTTYIPKTSAFTLAFSTSQRLRTTRASARTFFTFRHYITPSARNF